MSEHDHEQRALRQDALSLVHAIAIGVAGAAPAYSIAATTAAIIAAVGALAPASLFWCGLLMFGITFAFMKLNQEVGASAGASYIWVGRVFHPALGFLAGWAVLVSSALFMVAATIPAARASVALVAPPAGDDPLAVTLTAIAWLLALTAVQVRGIHLTGRMQAFMTALEIGVLAAILIAALHAIGTERLLPPALASLSPLAFDVDTFSTGAVIALFFFWGWDVALNLGEETRQAGRTPGLGALIAMLVLLCAFVGFTIIALAELSAPEIRDAGTNIVFVIAERLFPRPWSYLAVLALMLSSIGSIQVSVLQFARTLFAMSRAGELHARWACVHSRWRTPHRATLLNAALGTVLLLGSLAFPNVDEVMQASIGALGLQVAFYYGLAGFACSWHFRRQLRERPLHGLLVVVWPAAGALGLWAGAVLSLANLAPLTVAIAVGSLLAGIVPLALNAPLFPRRPA